MEGEAVLIAVVGAALVAYVIHRWGRQPAEQQPPPPDDESATTPDAESDPESAASRLRRLSRLPRQRDEDTSGADDTDARAARRTSVDAELLRTLEELAAHPQNRPAAVNLLRQRTGMSARQARRFINAL